jgi:hypothetical protein
MATRVTQVVKPVVVALSSGGSARVTQVVKVVIATWSGGTSGDLLKGMI